MAWLNGDGLYVKFGNEQGTSGIAGEYQTAGPQRMTEFTINLVALGTAAAILDDNVTLPSGARIEKIEIVTKTAVTSTGAAALNIGLVRTDRSTTYDEDGLIAALAITAYNAAGETVEITAGSTGAGALIGTTLANTGLVVADYDTDNYDTGVIHVRIFWSNPT